MNATMLQIEPKDKILTIRVTNSKRKLLKRAVALEPNGIKSIDELTNKFYDWFLADPDVLEKLATLERPTLTVEQMKHNMEKLFTK